MKITIINGPNLNLLGVREKDIYGSQSFEEYLDELRALFADIDFAYYQSNVEGELINELQIAGFLCDAIILNAGGYTHTSVAMADAVAAIKAPVVEVHLSNIFAREDFRHVSLLGKNCIGSISGFGLNSYRLAVHACQLHLG
jgi:3-dehydroquinate dehydratase-2